MSIKLKRVLIVFFLLLYIVPVITSQDKSKQIKEATVTYKRKPADPAKTKPGANTPSTDQSKKAEPKTEPATTSSAPATTSPALKNTTTPAASAEKYDTIVKLGGKKVPCTIKKINPTTVEYIKPAETVLLQMPRKDIEKIYYKTGRKEVLNKPIFSVIDGSQWEAVLVTENENDVQGLYRIAAVKAGASSGSRSPKAAKQSATIRLQKKTANLGALIVLVISSESKGGYGEVPGWELQGIAYSDTPPADTAAVNKAIRKMIERNKERINAAKKK